MAWLIIALTDNVRGKLYNFFDLLYNFKANNLSQIGAEIISALFVHKLTVWLPQ